MNLNELVPLIKAAKQLGMSEDSLRRRMHDGEIPYVEVNNRYFFTPVTLANYVPARKPPNVTDAASVSPKFNFRLSSNPSVIQDKTDIMDNAKQRVLRAWQETGIPAKKCLSYWDDLLGGGHVV